MAIAHTFGNVRLSSSLEPLSPEAIVRGDAPLRVAVLGDFSSRHSRPESEQGTLEQRRFKPVDRDNIQTLPGELGVELRCVRAPAGLRFETLDDFHPDELYARHDVFAELKELRENLFNPATFDATAKKMKSWASAAHDEPPAPLAPPRSDAPQPPGADLLAQVLAETARAGPGSPTSSGAALVEDLVRQVVAPYVIPAPDARQAALVESVDSAASEHLRQLLHDPQFQALEASWRGLQYLTRHLETGGSLKLEILDVSKLEIESDLMATDDLERTAVYKLLVEQAAQTPGATPFALVLGDFAFGATEGDALLLGRIGKVAAAAGAAFFAGAHPDLVKCASFGHSPDPDDWSRPIDTEAANAWSAVRALPEARNLCLSLPRMLLRLPYGTRTASVEAFEFEELSDEPEHDHYLWGNAAYAFTYTAALAFTQQGWPLDSGLVHEIGGLPVHTYKVDGESELKPCAEIALTERGGSFIRNQGLSPLWSIRGTDRVRVGPCHSLATD